MQIRLAQLDDAAGLARVHVDTWRAAYRGIVPQAHLDSLTYEGREQRWRDNLATVSTGVATYVATGDDSRIIGFAGGGPERGGDPTYKGELYALYVHPDHQRRGVGRGLSLTVVRHLVSKGYASMLVWVLAQNPSRAFYEALRGKYLYEKPIEIGGANLIEVAYGWPDIHALAQTEATT
jgi:GNAT superfamily N-acetyltransferase